MCIFLLLCVCVCMHFIDWLKKMFKTLKKSIKWSCLPIEIDFPFLLLSTLLFRILFIYLCFVSFRFIFISLLRIFICLLDFLSFTETVSISFYRLVCIFFFFLVSISPSLQRNRQMIPVCIQRILMEKMVKC